MSGFASQIPSMALLGSGFTSERREHLDIHKKTAVSKKALMPPPSAKSPSPKIVEVPIDPDPDLPPNKSSSSPGFLWSSLFAESASSNVPTSSPSYLADGTPVVIAPPSVLLRASSNWAGHLLCRFLGEPPSPAKFFSDLNRVWGKHGDISVRRFSSGVFLVYVPSASTRKWILQTGLWSSGTVSFVVSEWSVNSTLASPPNLSSATTLLTIREIPPQLWSHEAVATIAGGVAKLISGTRASLPLSSLGTASIRAIVPLGLPLPPSVMVKDAQGDSVLVSIEYGRLPHLCSICNSYGHQQHRCLLRKSATKPISPKLNTKPLENAVPDSMPELSSLPKAQKSIMGAEHDTSSHNMDLDNIYAPRQSSIQALEAISQSMELDSTVGEDLILKRTSDHQLDYASSSPTTDVIRPQPKVSCKESFPSQTIVLDHEGSSHSIEAGKAVECPSSIVHDIKQVQPSSSVPSSLLKSQTGADLQNIPSSDTHLEKVPHSTSPLDKLIKIGPIDILAPAASPGESQTHPEDIANPSLTYQTLPTNEQSKFDFPPPLRCVKEPDNDPSNVQLQMPTYSTGNKEISRDKRKPKLNSRNSLRCTKDKHQFKPKGVVEKGRRKVNQAQVPDDEEVNQCLLEIQSDQKNTLHYEALDAFKVLRKIDSETINVEST